MSILDIESFFLFCAYMSNKCLKNVEINIEKIIFKKAKILLTKNLKYNMGVNFGIQVVMDSKNYNQK